MTSAPKSLSVLQIYPSGLNSSDDPCLNPALRDLSHERFAFIADIKLRILLVTQHCLTPMNQVTAMNSKPVLMHQRKKKADIWMRSGSTALRLILFAYPTSQQRTVKYPVHKPCD